MHNRFVHNVFFWLKNPSDAKDAKTLETGIRTLFEVPTIRDSHLGKPAPTDRSVIDNTYSYHLMLAFNSLEDQSTYQSHPIHLRFVDDCAHLWEKVQVYDSDSSLLDD
ncbi:MAG: Dabb family protein [Bacteroidota bacterium]